MRISRAATGPFCLGPLVLGWVAVGLGLVVAGAGRVSQVWAQEAPRQGPRQDLIGAGRSESEYTAQILRRAQQTIDLFKRHRSSVVGIKVLTRGYPLPSLNLRGVTEVPSAVLAEEVEGTGFVVSADGLIATTYDLVRDQAKITVQFGDGTQCEATVAGTDPAIRLAVLRADVPERARPVGEPADAKDAGSVAWFLSAGPKQGDPSLAVVEMCSPRQIPKIYDRYLAGHADLTPGSAGGALLAADGSLLGMAVSALRSRAHVVHLDERGKGEGAAGEGEGRRIRSRRKGPSGSDKKHAERAQAIGCTTLFVPGSQVLRSVRAIAREGRVPRPLLGVVLDGLSSRIDVVLASSPAEKAGLQEGDRIVRLAGSEIFGLAHVGRVLLDLEIGETVLVEVDRAGKRLERPLTLADVRVPPAPTAPPLPGATLLVTARPLDEGPLDLTVTFGRIDRGSALEQVGVRVGDVLIAVEGRPALRYLNRHRFRASGRLPRLVEIEREGRRMEFHLGD